jgi:hypothetical protein
MPVAVAHAVNAIAFVPATLSAPYAPMLAPIHSVSVAVGLLRCAPFNLNAYSHTNRWSLFPADALFEHLGWFASNRDLREFVSSVSLIVVVGLLNGVAHLIAHKLCCASDSVTASHSRFPSALLVTVNTFIVGTTVAATRRAVNDPAFAIAGVAIVVVLALLLLRVVWRRATPRVFEEVRLVRVSATPQICSCVPVGKFFEASFWRPQAIVRRYGLLFAPYRHEGDSAAASSADADAVNTASEPLVDSSPRLAASAADAADLPTVAEQPAELVAPSSSLSSFVARHRTDIFQVVNVVLFVAEGVTIGASSNVESCHAQVTVLLLMMLAQAATAIALRPFRHYVFNVLTPAVQLSQVLLLAVFFTEGENGLASGLHVVFLMLQLAYIGFIAGCIGHERVLPAAHDREVASAKRYGGFASEDLG